MISRARNNILMLLSLLALSACGFAPLYGEKTSHWTDQSVIQEKLSDIYIEIIPDREGQYLRNSLMDRLYIHGHPANPRYTLKVEKISETRTNLDITKSADATRAQLRLTTKMSLKDRKNGQATVLDRTLHSITSYNILQSQFTTHVSEDNARKNALESLARQIERQLALYFGRTP